MGGRQAEVAWGLIWATLLALLAVSLCEALATVSEVGRQVARGSDPLLIGALLLVLIPSVTIALCTGEAILLPFIRFFAAAAAVAPPRSEPESRATRERGARVFAGAAFAGALLLAVVVLAVEGPGQRGIGAALRVTGRLSLLLFWPAFAGVAAAPMVGRPLAALLRRAREFGLAYAAAQLVHFGLVGWLFVISKGSVTERAMPFFAIGIVWTYLLALFSAGAARQLFGPRLLRILRTAGVEYIALLFIADFILAPLASSGQINLLAYLPFALLISLGVLLRLAAAARARMRGLAAADPL